MAIYQPHLYLTFGGFLGSSASNPGEIWQNGLRFAYDTGTGGNFEPATPSEESQQELATAALDPIQSWVLDSFGDYSAAVKLTWVKCAAIGATGAYIYDDAALEEFSPVTGGAQVGAQMPYQVARVLSMGGDRNRGRASRGRIYTPAPRASVGVDNTTDPTTAVTEFGLVVDALNGTVLTGGTPSGVAALGLFSSVDGSYQRVTRIGADTKLDTQRRRTAQIDTSIAWTDL